MRFLFTGFAFVFLVAACQNPQENKTAIPERNTRANKTLVDTLFVKTINTFLSDFKIYYFGTPYDRFLKISHGRQGIAQLQMPSANSGARYYVPNFTIDSLVNTEYGFKLCVSFGRQCCPYYDTYFFRHHPKDDGFYLEGFYLNHQDFEKDKCAEKFFFLNDPIPIRQVDFLDLFGLRTSSKDTLHVFTKYYPFKKSASGLHEKLIDKRAFKSEKIIDWAHIPTCGSDFYAVHTMSLLLIYRNKSPIASIPLPSMDVYSANYVKNFGIDYIVPTRYGFKVLASFGGGCCSYSDTYFFKYNLAEDNFYLQGFFLTGWFSYECKAAQKFLVLKNPIPIQEVNILQYFELSDTSKDTLHDFENYFSIECQ